MKKMAVQELRDRLPGILRTVAREPVAITRSGKVCAAIVSLNDLDFEAYALGQNPKFAAIIQRSRERGRREGLVSLQSLEKELRLPSRTRRTRRKRET